MKKGLKAILLASAFALLAACGGPSVDGKNVITFEESIRAMMQDMSQEEIRHFSNDIGEISSAIIQDMGGMTFDNVIDINNMMLEKLDGKSVEEVQKMAEAIRRG